MMADEEAQRHVSWQVLISAHLDLWANLPVAMTPTLEWAAGELVAHPFRFPMYPALEYRVFPVQTQTNIMTGRVRRMQRVVVLSI